MRFNASIAAVAAGVAAVAGVAADPTWPSSIDELEEIMYQLTEFQTRNFADTINPCTNEASGPGRQNAAEWLRVGFHDMSTADFAAGTGGLDASIMYELDTGENLGPAFNTTLQFLSRFLTSRSGMADLIALAVHASVRSCGGPSVPFRAGRIDAAGPGRTGVPQPEHPIEKFHEQFLRMGFTAEEMIQVTACGHTIGGVHETEFPEMLFQGEAPLDSSVADFDNKIVTEYLADNSTNPLIVGPAVGLGKDSDARIFASDGNITVKALADPPTFRDVCQKVLQKMIDTVPSNVVLTDPVLPYQAKPLHMQLTLNDDGRDMRLTGDIRIRTTDLPKEQLGMLTLQYKDRNGRSDCHSCKTTSSFLGVSYGFDDSFAFYPIDTIISASTGVSSFNFTIALTNGTSLFFDNNGNEYPLQDAVMIQTPNSCLTQHTGRTNVTAAIRNDRADLPVTLSITYKHPRLGLIVPALLTKKFTMARGDCVGHYTLYNADWTIPGGNSHAARIDIVSGSGDDVVVDDFNHAVDMPGMCQPFRGPPAKECTTAAVSAPTRTRTSEPPSLPTWSSPIGSVFPTTVMPPPLPTWSRPITGVFPTTMMPPASAVTSAPSPSQTHEFDLGLLTTTKSFLGGLVNYVANYFFGYDRFQLVNNQLDRVG